MNSDAGFQFCGARLLARSKKTKELERALKENLHGMRAWAKEMAVFTLFPAKCVFCGCYLDAAPDSIFVCENCARTLPYCESYVCCKVCGVPLRDSETSGDQKCPECKKIERDFERSISPFMYIGKVRKSILKYKMSRKRNYSPHYAKFMADMVLRKYDGITFDTIVAVPMTRARLVERGFDQAHELAKFVSEGTGIIYVKDVLKKVKKTKAQKGLDFDERQTNLAGSIMAVSSSQISGRNILLVDDVFTTGATLNECSKVLKGHGANLVMCVTLARTVKS